MSRKKLVVMLVLAILVSSAIAVSEVFCDGDLNVNSLQDIFGENSYDPDSNPCGGGDYPGPGGPQ